MDQNRLRKLWDILSLEVAQGSARAIRSVSTSDIYASWNAGHRSKELLIAGVDEPIDGRMPSWNGMAFSQCSIGAPHHVQYLVLELLDEGLEVPFACFCADVIESLESIRNGDRLKSVDSVVNIWNQFFLKGQDDIMPENRQRGLYAELWWLRRQLALGAWAEETVSSWMGPSRAFHDFDVCGHVVEVKSTTRKEPRKVSISNELQLSNRGLESLHLFVLTLNKQQIGESLPEMVDKLRQYLDSAPLARTHLDRKLVLTGYRDDHVERYTSCYWPRHEELFLVNDSFPRIVNIAEGLGDLKYSLQISACKPFEVALSPAPWIVEQWT
jgi:hypothetical protein